MNELYFYRATEADQQENSLPLPSSLGFSAYKRRSCSSLSPKSAKVLSEIVPRDRSRRPGAGIHFVRLDGNATLLFVFPRKEPLAVRSAVNRFSDLDSPVITGSFRLHYIKPRRVTVCRAPSRFPVSVQWRTVAWRIRCKLCYQHARPSRKCNTNDCGAR